MFKKSYALVFLILILLVLSPNLVFADDKDLVFYACPLSMATETVVEVTAKKISSNDKNFELRKTPEEIL